MSVSITPSLEEAVAALLQSLQQQTAARTFQAAAELHRAAVLVLSAAGSGRRYRLTGGGSYTASAPGEPPAPRTGAFRDGWTPTVSAEGNCFSARIVNTVHTANGGWLLGGILEEGTSRMAPRPYKERIVETALSGILRIYEAPFGG